MTRPADSSIGTLVSRVWDLTAQDKLAEALELLSTHADTRLLRTEVTLLARRLAEVERSSDSALMTGEEHSVRRNGITASVLQMLERLESGALDATPAFNLESLYKYGNLLLQRHEFERASDCFDRVLQHNPNHLAARVDRGVTRCTRLLFREAVEDFSVALEMDAAQPFARFNRGLALWHLGRYAEACADWRYVKELGFDLADHQLRDKCSAERKCSQRGSVAPVIAG